jgi:acyl dehydratase
MSTDTIGKEDRGLGFEQFWPGREFEGGERAVSDADIHAFAELSGDLNPLHLDDDYARSTPFGGRIAHGALGIAIATGLLAQRGLTAGTLIALVGVNWRFVAPIRPGDRLSLRLTVSSTRELSGRDGGLVTFAAVLTNQAAVVVQAGELVERVRRRSPASQTSRT